MSDNDKIRPFHFLTSDRVDVHGQKFTQATICYTKFNSKQRILTLLDGFPPIIGQFPDKQLTALITLTM